MPECLNWQMERVLAHERNRSTRHEIETYWSLADLAKANLTLDIFEEAERRQTAKAKHDAQMRALARTHK